MTRNLSVQGQSQCILFSKRCFLMILEKKLPGCISMNTFRQRKNHSIENCIDKRLWNAVRFGKRPNIRYIISSEGRGARVKRNFRFS